jgi:hypothetical protein
MLRNRRLSHHGYLEPITLVFFICLSSLSALGQTTGSVSGTVTDPQGGVVAGAPVALTSPAIGIDQMATTNSSGNFQFLLLPPGTYTLEVQASGFRTFRRQGIVVEADRSQAIPISLAVGQISETVEVAAGAVLLESNTSEVGTVMDLRKVQDLPLNGRNPMALAQLIPTVRGDLVFGGPVTKTFRGSQVNIGGGPNISNGFLLDGIPNDKIVDAPGAMTFLTADAVQEFKVLTNAFSAEYGRSVGGVISLISKSGTNGYHGLLSEFVRNTLFKSNDFFSNRNGVPRQPNHVNNYAATLGGPIKGGPIKKDKLFFFFNFEGYRSIQGFTRITTTPTALQKVGNFSQTVTATGAPIIIYDPLTTVPNDSGGFIRTPFQGNIIPFERQSKVAQTILGLTPLPNITNGPASGINNLSQSGFQPTNRDVEGIKVDYNLSGNKRLGVRYTRDYVNWTYPNYWGSVLETEGRNTIVPRHSFSITFTDILSPTLLLDVKAGYNRDNEIGISPIDQPHDVGGFTNCPTCKNLSLSSLGWPASLVAQLPGDRYSPNGKLPLFVITDVASIAGDNTDYRAGSALAGNFTLTKILGSHNLKTGYQYVFYQDSMGGGGFAASSFAFNRGFTQGPNPTAASATAGYGSASFLLGDASPAINAAIIPRQAEQAWGQKFSALFFQDDWKASRKLTLNLGLRWEYEGGITDRFNQYTNFDPNAVSPLASNPAFASLNLKGAPFFGTGGVTDGSRKHFGPRAGFAYQATSKLVVRGGYGIMWVPTKGNPVYQFSGFRVSNPMVASIDGGLTPFNTLDNPFPNGLQGPTGPSLGASTALGSDLQVEARNALPGYAQQYNLTLQYQPWNNWLIETAYLGNHGVRLMTSQAINYDQINPAYLSLGSQLVQSVTNPFYGTFTTGPLSLPTTTRQQLLQPYPQYNSVNGNYDFQGSSKYNAFTLKIEKRFSQGFSILAAYALSKLLDCATANKTASIPVVNWYNLQAECGKGNEDVPQRMVLTALWEVPFAKNAHGLKRQVLGGWHLNSVTTLMSGLTIPLTAGGTSNRPNVVPGCDPSLPASTLTGWFNTKCYTIPAPFTYGNASKTIPNVAGPGLQTIDASIFKDFTFKEKYTLTFRAEAFNLFNKPFFALPSGDVQSASFGVISQIGQIPPNVSGSGPRDFQFSLRLSF